LTSPIVVIDYGLANIRSVVNALSCFNIPVEVAENGADLDKSSAIVLPGVGSFDAGIHELRARGHADALQELVIGEGRPFLGICLGMQFVLEGSLEGDEPGLGWFAGISEILPKRTNDKRVLKVPHIGWNEVEIKDGGQMFKGIDGATDFYFNHSYYFPSLPDTDQKEKSENYLEHTCQYGLKFACAVERENISLVQFHPEKSQLAGMKLLENFVSQAAMADQVDAP
jgi:imidazole glycerol-phosphate synthase subunit HisH